MKVLLAKKEYIYYFLEYMYSNLRYVDAGDRVEEFVELVNSMDLEVLAVGDFEPTSSRTKVYSIEEFADLYFELRNRNQVTDDGLEHLDEYCELLEEFLAK